MGSPFSNRGLERRKAPVVAPEARVRGKLERLPDGSLRTRESPSEAKEREAEKIRRRLIPAMAQAVEDLIAEVEAQGGEPRSRRGVRGFLSLKHTLDALEGRRK